MTKISQLTDLGAGLAAGDEFIVRDVSEVSTPNKKVTASGFIDYVIAQGVGAGFTQIAAGVGPLARVLASSSGATGALTFSTASATTLIERACIDSSGRLLVGLTPANTSGAKLQTSDGLTFPATQVASADPNTLDDYEEGTWTPTIANTGYTYTYSNQTGTYTKVGRTVTLSWRVAVTARSGSASGGLPIVAIPFASSASFTGSAQGAPQPAQLVIHKAATGTTTGIRTFLYSGLANGANSYFWIGAIATNGDAFDIGADFDMGGVFIYEV